MPDGSIGISSGMRCLPFSAQQTPRNSSFVFRSVVHIVSLKMVAHLNRFLSSGAGLEKTLRLIQSLAQIAAVFSVGSTAVRFTTAKLQLALSTCWESHMLSSILVTEVSRC
jgi:hypothetical protein